jgi:hypothetical protein
VKARANRENRRKAKRRGTFTRGERMEKEKRRGMEREEERE